MSGEFRDSLLIGDLSKSLNRRHISSFFIPQFFNIKFCNFVENLILIMSFVLIKFLDKSTFL